MSDRLVVSGQGYEGQGRKMANTLDPRVMADVASAGYDTVRRLDAAVLTEQDAVELVAICVTAETRGTLAALGLEDDDAALGATLYRRVLEQRARAEGQRRGQAAVPLPEKVLKRRHEKADRAEWDRRAAPIAEPMRQYARKGRWRARQRSHRKGARTWRVAQAQHTILRKRFKMPVSTVLMIPSCWSQPRQTCTSKPFF